MIDTAFSILTLAIGYLITLVAIVFVHEVGHYLTGRFLVGIPRSDIRIVMGTFPQHVALRDGDEWVGPFEAQYNEQYRQYDPEGTHAIAYIASGELVQTGGVVVAASVLAGSGLASAAQLLVLFSLFLTASYLVYEGAVTLTTDYPAGDYSALWAISPGAAVGTVLCVVIPHVVVYSLV